MTQTHTHSSQRPMHDAWVTAKHAYLAAEDAAVEAAVDVIMDVQNGRFHPIHAVAGWAARSLKRMESAVKQRRQTHAPEGKKH